VDPRLGADEIMAKLAPLEEVLGTVRRLGAPERLTPVGNGLEAGLYAILAPLGRSSQVLMAVHALPLACSYLSRTSRMQRIGERICEVRVSAPGGGEVDSGSA
jgi:hypothetical protein